MVWSTVQGSGNAAAPEVACQRGLSSGLYLYKTNSFLGGSLMNNLRCEGDDQIPASHCSALCLLFADLASRDKKNQEHAWASWVCFSQNQAGQVSLSSLRVLHVYAHIPSDIWSASTIQQRGLCVEGSGLPACDGSCLPITNRSIYKISVIVTRQVSPGLPRHKPQAKRCCSLHHPTLLRCLHQLFTSA